MAGITHATVATGVDSGDQVSKNAWNAEHEVADGALAQAKVAGLVAALDGKQASADILAALAALDGTAGILRVTGAGTVTRLTDTVAGRALLEAADAAAQRLALGLGTAATTDATAYATAAHNHAQADVTGLVDALTARAPGGAAGTVQYNDAGALGGAANLSIHGGDLVVATGTPTTPSAGAKLYSLDLAGRAMLAQTDANGVGVPMQASLGRARVAHWNWPGAGTTAPIAYGIAAPTIAGTAQTRTPASTNLFTSLRRGGYNSATAVGSMSSIRSGVAQFWRGNSPGLGGFYCVFRFGTSDPATVAGARMFIGFSTATGAASNVEPDTLVNAIGVGQLSTSSNLHVIHNDVGGTATTIDLGVNFPADTLSADMYELTLYAPPNGSGITYRVERLGTAYVASNTISSNIPSTSTFLGIQMWRTNNATALGVALDAVSMYVETNY